LRLIPKCSRFGTFENSLKSTRKCAANRTKRIIWWHSNFLILTLVFKIVDFAHFFGRDLKNNFLCDINHPLGLLNSENDVSCISTEKAFYQNVEKTPFFGTFNQISDP
jgi:hypothetical protein